MKGVMSLSFVYAIFMGILQGLTEFLPVSSSGHLVLLQQILGFEEMGLGFNIILHIGTLIAVVIYYRDDLFLLIKEFFSLCNDILLTRGKPNLKANEHRLLLVMLIIAILPTAAIGFVFNDLFESLFKTWYIVGYTLIITGILLWISNYLPVGSKQANNITFKDALFVGLIQGAAITPGISRSGTTIFAGLVTGFTRDLATRFSFLLSVPAILAAVVLEGPEIIKELSLIGDFLPVLSGLVASTVSGYLAIDLLISLLKKQKLQYFSYYCWVVGGLTILYHWIYL
jgi:undecaprenyl-diphosphatase